MYFARPTAPTLGDATAGDPDVVALQAALAQLSMAALRPGINPGPQTGVVNDQTMSGVVNALDILNETLPSWVQIVLQAAMIGGATTSVARAAVKDNALYLAAAASAGALKYGGPQYGGFMPALPQPWYASPSGMIILGVGAIVVYKILHKPKAVTS